MRRIGQCNRCGDCCTIVGLTSGNPALSMLAGLLDESDSRCPHLVIENGKATCRIYGNRPVFCKAFPAELMDICSQHCGYLFIPEEVS